ncbi:hypothetical protein [Kibdelosporangium aridum]|uniref:Uncharacterized protein n=1 Tax=Kibdelosporangium aridum TaxID=2030 RepID=A0A1W2AQY2_KIBAR|nr:hypothetical protein [Kibdelosporangium aridum]SMC62922.1 hypothetical protein SAMN05661093_01032 [Kibdelosporangium aridum]
MIATLAAATLTDTIHTFFADFPRSTGTVVTDLVIDELDQWHNPMESVASFSKPTFSHVAIGAHQLSTAS